MLYKYETHLHTSEASACATSRGADYIKAYKEAGYAGIFVTDHFFGGNCGVDRSLSWEEKINLYCKGYENAKHQAEELYGKDFSVFFGLEQTFQGDDYLIYGLDKEWLLNNPEVEHMNHAEIFQAVNQVNGLMIQAHPFRFRQYMRDMHQHPLEVHGIEVYNGGNKPIENEMAKLYAEAFNFPVTSGSDIHNVAVLLNPEGHLPVGGMAFETPVTSVFDYAKKIKSKEGKIIY